MKVSSGLCRVVLGKNYDERVYPSLLVEQHVKFCDSSRTKPLSWSRESTLLLSDKTNIPEKHSQEVETLMLMPGEIYFKPTHEQVQSRLVRYQPRWMALLLVEVS